MSRELQALQAHPSDAQQCGQGELGKAKALKLRKEGDKLKLECGATSEDVTALNLDQSSARLAGFQHGGHIYAVVYGKIQQGNTFQIGSYKLNRSVRRGGQARKLGCKL